MVITRNLQKQLSEKEDKIKIFESKLANLEQNSGKTQKTMEKNFEGQISEINRKHDNSMQQKDGEIKKLDKDLHTLNEFKDTKPTREETLAIE